jgi:long-chain fatty acid transport protein
MNWSSFKTLAITLPGGTQQVIEEDYKNTTSLRVGAEYKFPHTPAAVRAGFIYDPTPIPTQTLTAQLPDANRKDITVGGSYGFGDYGVHASLLYVLPSKRTTSDEPFMPVYKAEYEVSAVVATLSLTGTFGAPAGSQ